ncbi:hypothetical protein [Faecalimonas umbilicata]|uniref:hypothetical protein n=1 Tax=Faecalimonas umbilicata TaxID=1912855 RepID=UPI0022E44B66|nr:hypothetical protein [Faecalimonas umbilicata]
MTKEKVLENLNKLVGKKFDEDEIICSFEDYEEDGETDIVVSDSNNSGYDKIAYINVAGAAEFYFSLSEGMIKEVWMN